MALLSLSNHSIVSYGTFGMWGALLSGRGETVLPKDITNTDVGMAIRRAKIPRWKFIWRLKNIIITEFCTCLPYYKLYIYMILIESIPRLYALIVYFLISKLKLIYDNQKLFFVSIQCWIDLARYVFYLVTSCLRLSKTLSAQILRLKCLSNICDTSLKFVYILQLLYHAETFQWWGITSLI